MIVGSHVAGQSGSKALEGIEGKDRRDGCPHEKEIGEGFVDRDRQKGRAECGVNDENDGHEAGDRIVQAEDPVATEERNYPLASPALDRKILN